MGSHADEIKLSVAEAITRLQEAREYLEEGRFEAAVSQAADSALHTAHALLWDEDIDPEKHGDVLPLIQDVFVNGRRLTKEQGANLSWLLGLKRAEPEGSSKTVSPDEAQRAVEIAGSFFEAAKVILQG